MLNSSVPKLLAKENIDVVFGNYETAFFDVEKRVLGMPVRANQDKDIESLFYLHEVGHALHTPQMGWHDSIVDLGIPRDIVNIVEDARIEKLVQREYPGAVSSFNRGYKKLVEKEFFGPISNEAIAEMGFLDRLNIKCKLKDQFYVEFSAEEEMFYKRALTLESWHDVVVLSKDLMDFIKAQQPEKLDNQEEQEFKIQDESDTTNDTQNQESSVQSQQSGSEAKEEVQGNADQDQPSDKEEENKISEIEDTQGEEESEEETQKFDDLNKDFISTTDREFRKKELEMNTQLNNDDVIVCSSIKYKDAMKLINDYDYLASQRSNPEDHSYFKYSTELHEDAYYDYMKKVKRNVMYAVKEFEMRKNAYQHTRAQIRDTGVLNVNKIHSYKYNDNIFGQLTQLAQFKNHGIVMLLDWSGSMSSILSSVIDQLIHLVTFCKKINVPFEVYSFTSKVSYNENNLQFNSNINFEELQYNELLSSTMSKSKFEEACYYLYMCRFDNSLRHFVMGNADHMGGTPLQEALLVSDHVITRFKKRNNVNKVNFVCLTDGDAHMFNIKNLYVHYRKEVCLVHENTTFRFNKDSLQITADLLDYISKKHKTNNIGFFVSSSKRDALYRIGRIKMIDSEWANIYDYVDENRSKINKVFRKDNCYEMQNVVGYNNYFVTVDSNLEISDDEEFTVNSNSKSDVLKSFKKFQSNKKTNKILMGKIGRAFA